MELNDLKISPIYDAFGQRSKYKQSATMSFNITFLFMTIEEYYAVDQPGYYRTQLSALCSSDSKYDIKQLNEWSLELGIPYQDLSKDEICKRIKYWIDRLEY